MMKIQEFDFAPTVKLTRAEKAAFRTECAKVGDTRRAREAFVAMFVERLTGDCCMITLTLKKNLKNEGSCSPSQFMNKELGLKQAKYLRTSFFRSVYKSDFRARRIEPVFVGCYEEGAVSNNPHLHVIIQIPLGMDIHDVKQMMIDRSRKCSERFLWNVDVKLVYDKEGALRYIFKTGLDSVIF